MSLVYFSRGTFRFWLDSEWGNSFLSQKAVLVLGGLQPVTKAEMFSCECHGLQWQERGRKTKRVGEEEGWRKIKKKKRERKISFLVLTRYKLLIRNISAVRLTATLTQLALCWWCVSQKICRELWGLCPSVPLPPNTLPALVTCKSFNSSLHLAL